MLQASTLCSVVNGTHVWQCQLRVAAGPPLRSRNVLDGRIGFPPRIHGPRDLPCVVISRISIPASAARGCPALMPCWSNTVEGSVSCVTSWSELGDCSVAVPSDAAPGSAAVDISSGAFPFSPVSGSFPHPVTIMSPVITTAMTKMRGSLRRPVLSIRQVSFPKRIRGLYASGARMWMSGRLGERGGDTPRGRT